MNILTEFLNYLGAKALILVFLYVFVFLAVMLDLWSGVRKAKQRNEYISSYGLRETLNKLSRYFNVLLAVTLIDLIQMLAIFELRTHNVGHSIPILPFFTFIATGFICFIEAKSIFEKAEQKEKAKAADAARTIDAAIRILKKDNTLDEILTKLNSEKENENN